jgi:hypothetical protein
MHPECFYINIRLLGHLQKEILTNPGVSTPTLGIYIGLKENIYISGSVYIKIRHIYRRKREYLYILAYLHRY